MPSTPATVVDTTPTSVPLKRAARGSHRRSQTIVGAGSVELQQLQKRMQMEVLQHDLESKSKELEESQEEAHLAALIGQSLLQRTEEMGAEIESTAMELVDRAESAEHEVKILESKLSKAYAHIRSMEIAKAKTVDDADEMTHELDALRVRTHVLRTEVTKAHDETQRVYAAKDAVDDELERTRDALTSLRAAYSRALADFTRLGERIHELEATERYNLEHIARLEIENQSICLQHRVQERRETKLVGENEALAAKLTAQRHAVREAETERTRLSKAVETLHEELDDVRDAVAAEQLRVAHLTKLNKELQDRIDNESKPEDDEEDEEGDDDPHPVGAMGCPAASARLRHGSLFYELSMQLKEEMRLAQSSASRHSDGDSDANQVQSEKSSPSAESGKASASSRNAGQPDAEGGDDDNNDSSTSSASQPPAMASATTQGASSLPPPSLLSRSEGQEDDEGGEEDILKEFFMLTAAAVKIAGGGLGNDACNILNEDLYEEALDEGLTFDQFHAWLERRLEGGGEPETHDAASEKKEKPITSSKSSLAPSGRRAF